VVTDTFPRLMLAHAKQRPDAPALREKEYGIWQTWTWQHLSDQVRALASGLAQAGLQPGLAHQGFCHLDIGIRLGQIGLIPGMARSSSITSVSGLPMAALRASSNVPASIIACLPSMPLTACRKAPRNKGWSSAIIIVCSAIVRPLPRAV